MNLSALSVYMPMKNINFIVGIIITLCDIDLKGEEIKRRGHQQHVVYYTWYVYHHKWFGKVLKYILSLICFAIMDFSEKYDIEDASRDVRYH